MPHDWVRMYCRHLRWQDSRCGIRYAGRNTHYFRNPSPPYTDERPLYPDKRAEAVATGCVVAIVIVVVVVGGG